jgi:DNA-binding NtrC family response regulator
MLVQQNGLKLGSASAGKRNRKFARRPAIVSPMDSQGTAVEQRRAIAVFSRDDSIVELIAEGLSDSWIIEKFSNLEEARAFLRKPGVRIVVIDDEAVEESTRGWLLDQVRKNAPHALVAYIAGVHSLEIERRARTYLVQYYTAKPIDRERTLRVLHSFEHAIH